MKAAKKTKQVLELDVFYLPFPMQEKKGDRPRYPQCFIVADPKTKNVMPPKILEQDTEAADAILDFLEEWVNEQGRPEKIKMRSAFVGTCLMDFCRQTGIALEMAGTPLLDTVIRDIIGHIDETFEEEDS